MHRQRVVVRFRAGPTWDGGSIREQPAWDDHAEWVDRLVDDGVFVMGGPFSDNSGSMVLFEGLSAVDVRRLLPTDPFMENGVFVLEDVREWTVFVDELTARGG
jgi:uncharacterized protein